MSCSQVRRELLEHFAFREELGPRSWPHLAHLESCAECRQEVGIDRGLVRQLRRALRERVEGGAPSDGSWELVRRRTVDRPVLPWTVRVLRWGGMASSAAVGLMMFAAATTSDAKLLRGTQPPFFDASLARRALVLLDEAGDRPSVQWNTDRTAEADLPPKGWPIRTQTADDGTTNSGEPPIPGRMR